MAGIFGRNLIIFGGLIAPPGRRLRQSHVRQRKFGGNGEQLIEYFFSEDLIDAFAVSGDGRGDENGISRGMQLKMFIGMRESVMCDQGGDVRKFGGFRLQEFLACRGIKEEIANRDGCSGGKPNFFHAKNLSAINLDDGS